MVILWVFRWSFLSTLQIQLPGARRALCFSLQSLINLIQVTKHNNYYFMGRCKCEYIVPMRMYIFYCVVLGVLSTLYESPISFCCFVSLGRGVSIENILSAFLKYAEYMRSMLSYTLFMFKHRLEAIV